MFMVLRVVLRVCSAWGALRGWVACTYLRIHNSCTQFSCVAGVLCAYGCCVLCMCLSHATYTVYRCCVFGYVCYARVGCWSTCMLRLEHLLRCACCVTCSCVHKRDVNVYDPLSFLTSRLFSPLFLPFPSLFPLLPLLFLLPIPLLIPLYFSLFSSILCLPSIFSTFSEIFLGL